MTAEANVVDTVPCPSCGSDEHDPSFTGSDALTGGGVFLVARCRACGLVYTRTRPTPGDLVRHYPARYYEGMPERSPRQGRLRQGLRAAMLSGVFRYPNGTPSRVPSPAGRRAARLLVRVLGRDAGWVPWVESGSLLDVGAGRGSVLASYVSLGWSGVGVELSDHAAALARKSGLDVRTGTLAEQWFPPDRFDAAVVNHVLEHVPDLQATLHELARVIRPGGWLLIRLPNVASWEARLYGRLWFPWELPRHLTHFGPDTLRAVLEKSGFEIVRLRAECRPGNVGSNLSFAARQRFGLRIPARLGALALLPFSLIAAWAGRSSDLAVLARKR